MTVKFVLIEFCYVFKYLSCWVRYISSFSFGDDRSAILCHSEFQNTVTEPSSVYEMTLSVVVEITSQHFSCQQHVDMFC